MMRSRTKAIVIATAITTLLSATAVYAATTSNSSVHAPKFSRTYAGAAKGGFKSHLDSLVTASTITQDQEATIQNAVTAAMKSGAGNGGIRKGPNNGFKTILDGLVTASTITQDQEAAIQNAVTAAMKSGAGKGEFKKGPNNGFKTILDGLVTAGTITQAQETAVLSM